MKNYDTIQDRKVGNSTRLADSYIQEFFTYGKIEVFDHYMNGENHKANCGLLRVILNRIRFEHRIDELFIDVDMKHRATISLSKEGLDRYNIQPRPKQEPTFKEKIKQYLRFVLGL